MRNNLSKRSYLQAERLAQVIVAMTDGCRLCVFIWAVLLLSSVVGYRPVILVHGIFGGLAQMAKLTQFIEKSHPDTSVTTLAIYDYMASTKPMWEQVAQFREAIIPIMESADDGVHLICYAQGGLICRGVLATLPQHNVHSLIILSSPLAGQYGDPDCISKFFPTFIKSTLYQYCYSKSGQTISFCNYWKDPHQREKYLRSSVYLAPLNGEVDHADSTAWRNNFQRIKKLVLVGGQDDGVITPWQSSMFGFYDHNENIVAMENQDFYLRNAFGLKTLNSRGDVVKCVVPGVHHKYWPKDYNVYQKCIEKWLT